jgi:L-seryl-tRNA(Ser) seleniumtransferase
MSTGQTVLPARRLRGNLVVSSSEIAHMANDAPAAFRKIPSVDALLQSDPLRGRTDVARSLLVEAVREAVDEVRALLLRGCAPAEETAIRSLIIEATDRRLRQAVGPHYRRAINATGIILHTGLGRAVLPARALRQINEHLSGYSVLQVDEETGGRGRREERIEWLLQRLTGCEAATVANNNAAATMIVLAVVGRGREVIVSRGQLVEIGGSFRLPEVMAASGARMVEVGTTNKTHPRDYESAITDQTAAILRVHPSNYRIMGFTEEVPPATLASIAHARGIAFIDDVGAGALLDFSRFGFHDQPTLPEAIRAGADLVISSADKLIGSSQGGLIMGKAELIQKIRKDPLARILRVGKLTLAALEATLSLFMDETAALREVPTLAMLARPLSDIGAQAERIAAALRQASPAARADVIDGESQMGSGSMPTQTIATRLVAVTSDKLSADDLLDRLRAAEPPLIARINDGRVLIDPRTLLDGDEASLIAAFTAALQS